MAARKFSHHFVPHHHPDEDEHHRAHALGHNALVSYVIIFALTIVSVYFIRTNAPQILGTAQYTAEQIIQLTNVKRAEEGLGPLSSNTLLANAASLKAQDMLVNNYWAHYSPQGKTPWSFISAAGYKYIYAGENLARDFNDPQAVVNAWMASPTHRSNILDKNFDEIGVAVTDGNLTGKEGVLVVQMFGSAVSQVPASEPLAQVPEPQAQDETEADTAGAASGTEDVSQPLEQTEPIREASNSVIIPANTETATVLASNQYSVSKLISLALVSFVFLLFAVEVAVVSKKSHLKLKSSTLAHLGMLALVLFALWYAVQGSVI